MGISCATEVFTEHVRRILEGIISQVNMTDDVVIQGGTEEAHQRSLLTVLKRLQDNGLTLNLAKCEFYKGKSRYTACGSSAQGSQGANGHQSAPQFPVYCHLEFPVLSQLVLDCGAALLSMQGWSSLAVDRSGATRFRRSQMSHRDEMRGLLPKVLGDRGDIRREPGRPRRCDMPVQPSRSNAATHRVHRISTFDRRRKALQPSVEGGLKSRLALRKGRHLPHRTSLQDRRGQSCSDAYLRKLQVQASS